MIFRRGAKHKIAKKLLDNVPKNHFLPCPYQFNLLDSACERNTIICLSNELTKNFVVLNLIREMLYHHRNKKLLYFTQDNNIRDAAECLKRHNVGLSVACHHFLQGPKALLPSEFAKELMRHEILVLSVWLIPALLLSEPSGSPFREFLRNCVHLIVLSECHCVLSPLHPYSDLLRLIDPKWDGLRIIAFTSALLPMGITDPYEAESRLEKLESLTHCRVETASELLTMLSLGARPQEHIYGIPSSARIPTETMPFHNFVRRHLAETQLVLTDACDIFQCHTTSNAALQAKSPPAAAGSVPDSRGRMIDVLDYCRRAVAQCEKILSELGAWCAGKIARVFVKHLIALERRRALLIGPAGIGLDRTGSMQKPPLQMPHDQLTRLLRFTATQLCIITRLFQMISPKIITLVDQLKLFKPSTNFRIEVARVRENPDMASSKKASRRRGRSGEHGSLISLISSPDRSILLGTDMDPSRPQRSSSFVELPREPSPLSELSDDTMSSVSDSSEGGSMWAMRHYSPSCAGSTHSRHNSAKRNKNLKIAPQHNPTNLDNLLLSEGNAGKLNRNRNLRFFPASQLPRVEGFDPNKLVYRAVVPKPDDQEEANGAGPQPAENSVSIRLCGLVMVTCQFTAYALSRLIDELCVWDEEMFFLKPSHLFAHQSSALTKTGQSCSNTAGSVAARQTALKTGDETVAAPQGFTNLVHSSLSPTQEVTISQFRAGTVNLLVATQAAVSAAAGGAELPRCNLVVSLHPPFSLAEYLASKARSRLVDDNTRVVYLIDEEEEEEDGGQGCAGDISASCETNNKKKNIDAREILSRFRRLEDLLVHRCHGYSLFADEHEIEPTVADTILLPFAPFSTDSTHKYCARLPSDYFTSLTPRWRLRVINSPADYSPPAVGTGACCGEGAVCHSAWLRRRQVYQCLLRLPINTPVKQCIKGEVMACKKLAKLSAALNAIKALYELGELTSKWRPKTSAGTINPIYSVTSPPMLASGQSDLILTHVQGSAKRRVPSGTNSFRQESRHESDTDSADFGDDLTFTEDGGSLKQVRRRQSYYHKFGEQIRECFPLPGDSSCNYLYYIDMRLTNPLPEELIESSRHRTCSHRPEEEPLGFGIMTRKALRCVPDFPLFSRSGEETIRLVELWCPLDEYTSMVASDPQLPLEDCLPIPCPSLNEAQIEQLVKFHRIVFRGVLRLERHLIMELDFQKAYTQLLIVPARRDTLDIDWKFLELVLSSDTPDGVCRLLPRRKPVVSCVGESSVCSHQTNPVSPAPPRQMKAGRVRGSNFKARHAAAKLSLQDTLSQPGVFDFRAEDFINGVVMPAYRNIDQPQHYYVSEIRYDLNPRSPFPSMAYPTFAAYFSGKYEVSISSMDQPLLDVDFTALRLNLLVPRYLASGNSSNGDIPATSVSSVQSSLALRRQQDRRDGQDAHKQILLPELCLRHPFPASVWRKAVCLPSVLYRLEYLLLAEELRQRISRETGMGRLRGPPVKLVQLKSLFIPAQPDAAVVVEGRQFFEPLRVTAPLFIPPPGRMLSPSLSTTTDSGHLAVTSATKPVGQFRRRASRRRGDKKAGSEGGELPPSVRFPDRDNLLEQTPSPASLSTNRGSGIRPPDSDEDEDDYRSSHAVNKASEEVGGNPEPQYVSLRATPANAAPPGPTSTDVDSAGRLGNCITDLLDETKVIELGCDPETFDPDPDPVGFMLVKNVRNIDREYKETDSDVESEDSFEGNVLFFPTDDDDDDDDLSDAEAGADAGAMEDYATAKPSVGAGPWSSKVYQPGPASILQALTMSSANDFINLERMETIGDNFLKFVVTVHLFLSFPNAHEGKLSHLRNRVVCNVNLYRLGRAKRLPELMVANKFWPCENWVPPGYYVRQDPRIIQAAARQARSQSSQVIWSTDAVMDDMVMLQVKPHDESRVKPIEDFPIGHWDPQEAEVLLAQQTLDQRSTTLQHIVPDKSVADCIEALIGCYLTTRGERSALRLMRWLGIDCFPQDVNFLRPRGVPWMLCDPKPAPDDPRTVHLDKVRRAWGFDELESQINYKFNNPSLLVQALTHPSYYELLHNDEVDVAFCTDTDCYQRLEFLGDAVLDYVITRFLYNDSQQHSPGVLTDLRSALVNNNIFAALTVRFGLHRFLRASSPQLLHTLEAFVRYQKDIMHDDLDFITNEDVEVRQLSQSDLSVEEATQCLASNKVNTDSSDSLQTPRAAPNGDSDTEEGGQQQTGDDDEIEDKEEDRVASANNMCLLSQSEAVHQQQQTAEEQARLTAGLVSPYATAPARPISSALTSSPLVPTQHHHLADDIEIPKALGDIFESLAGAVFLDSGLSLNKVWEVFYPLMKERIERYTSCIPKSPVRQLLELEPEGTRFERPRRTADGRISVCAHVLGKGRFYGIGRNYRLAKSLAAKRALRVLRKVANNSADSEACAPRAASVSPTDGVTKERERVH